MATTVPSDLRMTNELKKYLRDGGAYPSKEEKMRIQEAVGRLGHALKSWVKAITKAKGNAKILSCGAYRFGAHTPGDEIDMLFLVPEYISRDIDFPGELCDTLKKIHGLQDLRIVLVPLKRALKFKLNGVMISLQFTCLDTSFLCENIDILKKSILKLADKQALSKLSISRVTECIIQLVPDIENFRYTLKCLIFWARCRGVYLDMIGFLNGVKLAVLVAHVCLLYPQARPNKLVSWFFKVYDNWSWPNPVMLCPIEEGSLQLLASNTKSWDRDMTHHMPIITPVYPYTDINYNVSFSTLRVMKKEFQRGRKICEEIEANKTSWTSLFESYRFFEAYDKYLQIKITAEYEADIIRLEGCLGLNFQRLIWKIEENTHKSVHCHPHPNHFSECLGFPNRYFFWGLDQTAGEELRGINQMVFKFKKCVIMHTFWKIGMMIHVDVLDRLDIPKFVFSGGSLSFGSTNGPELSA